MVKTVTTITPFTKTVTKIGQKTAKILAQKIHSLQTYAWRFWVHANNAEFQSGSYKSGHSEYL